MIDEALTRLRDAREFADHGYLASTGLSAEVLAEAREPLYAPLYCLCIVGEALNFVPADIKSTASQIPWEKIKATRNRLIHAYRQVDLEIVANIVGTHLPPLIEALDDLIRRLEAGLAET